MTLSSEHENVDRLSSHGQFRGAKFSKMIHFGVNESDSSILLEGVMLLYRDVGLEEESIRANGKIQRVSTVTDDVGSLSFWTQDDGVRCQIELLAAPEVFDDIYATLCTLKENSLYNFFINMNTDTLRRKDNRVREYTLMFIENQ
jgi:hypothetical protein